jgi:hypothetical protein
MRATMNLLNHEDRTKAKARHGSCKQCGQFVANPHIHNLHLHVNVPWMHAPLQQLAHKLFGRQVSHSNMDPLAMQPV